MKMSAGVEWAVHCTVVLSAARTPVTAHQLATLHDVPPAYLAKHLQALSRAGILTTTPGQAGGYRLARPASELSVLDVVLAVEGYTPAFVCTEIRRRGPLAARPQDCARPCGIAAVMAQAEQAWRGALAAITVADLAQRFRDGARTDPFPTVRAWLEA